MKRVHKKRCREKRPFVIGVTGAIGSGKTTVSRLIAGKGGLLIDADEVVHDLLEKDRAVCRKLIENFGNNIKDREGKIDRKKLSARAFSSDSGAKRLEDIIHPEAIKRILKSMEKAGGKKGPEHIVIDAPLLIESGVHVLADFVVVVKSGYGKRMERIRKRESGISQKEAARRSRYQLSGASKERYADYIVNNSNDIRNTKKEVTKAIKDMRKIWLKGQASQGDARRR